jgi:hypothetical protein
MAKKVTDAYLDGGLDRIDDSNRLSVLSAEPNSIADITTNFLLAATALTPGSGNGDFLKANGDINGRKLTVSQQTDISISTSGDATHVSLDDGTDYYVTTCTLQTLTAGGTVTVPSWDIEFADPV